MMTNRNYSVDLSSLSDKELIFEIAKELCFNEKVLANKSAGDKTPIRLLK